MTEDKTHKDRDLSDKKSKFLNKYLTDSGYNIAVKAEKDDNLRISANYFEQSINWKHNSVLRLIAENTFSKDPSEIIREKSRSMVLEAFTRGWKGPPFDVIELAKMNGYKVHPNELVVDARILPNNDSFTIEYNPFQSPARINFSVAHEIAHTLFSDCGETVRYRKNDLESGSWQLEFLCNIGAAELLLPYAEFTNTANEVDLDIESLINISRLYNSSVESVFLRFSQVVDKPCTIVICSFTVDGRLIVDYSKNSTNSNLTVPKGYYIPKYSNVYDCLKAGFTSHGIETWDLFKNSRYVVQGVGLSPIKKQIKPRVGLLIAPEHYNHKSNKGINIVYGDATTPRGAGKKIITQVINSSGGLGFGFGKAMSQAYPISKKSVIEWKKNKESFQLGNHKVLRENDQLYIFQILAQKGIYPKYGVVPLKYDKLRLGLIALRSFALSKKASVHMPAIGAGQAGGDWNIIKGMIYDELITHNLDVTIYLLPGKNTAPNQSRTLTLFNKDAE